MSRVNYDVTIDATTSDLSGTLALTLGLAPDGGAAAAKTGTGTAQFPPVPMQGEKLQ